MNMKQLDLTSESGQIEALGESIVVVYKRGITGLQSTWWGVCIGVIRNQGITIDEYVTVIRDVFGDEVVRTVGDGPYVIDTSNPNLEAVYIPMSDKVDY